MPLVLPQQLRYLGMKERKLWYILDVVSLWDILLVCIYRRVSSAGRHGLLATLYSLAADSGAGECGGMWTMYINSYKRLFSWRLLLAHLVSHVHSIQQVFDDILISEESWLPTSVTANAGVAWRQWYLSAWRWRPRGEEHARNGGWRQRLCSMPYFVVMVAPEEYWAVNSSSACDVAVAVATYRKEMGHDVWSLSRYCSRVCCVYLCAMTWGGVCY